MRSILRSLAPCVVVVALLMLSRTKHENLLVVVLEGARVEDLRALAGAGHTATLSATLSAGIAGDLVVSRSVDGMDGVTSALLGGTVDGTARRVWLDLSRRSRRFALVGVAGTELREERAAVVLPGPDATHGFIGSNLGTVVNRKSLERTALPWPYELVSARIKKAVEDLPANGVSGWIEIVSAVDARRGILRVYGLDDDTVYLTPVYTRFTGSLDGKVAPYVADEPSAVSVSSRAREYLPRHVADLADARVDFASTILSGAPADLVVYVDRSLVTAPVAKGASHGSPSGAAPVRPLPTTKGEDAYVAVERRLAKLTEVVGPRAIVLVVGVDPSFSSDGTVGWFSMATSDGSSAWLRVSVDELAASVRYLLALPPSGSAAPLPAIAAAYPTRGSRAPSKASADSRAVVPLSTATLRELAPSAGDSDRGPLTAASEL